MALKKATKRATKPAIDATAKYYVHWAPRLMTRDAAIKQAQQQLVDDLEYGESNGIPVLFEAVGIVTIKDSPRFANLPEVS